MVTRRQIPNICLSTNFQDGEFSNMHQTATNSFWNGRFLRMDFQIEENVFVSNVLHSSVFFTWGSRLEFPFYWLQVRCCLRACLRVKTLTECVCWMYHITASSSLQLLINSWINNCLVTKSNNIFWIFYYVDNHVNLFMIWTLTKNTVLK